MKIHREVTLEPGGYARVYLTQGMRKRTMVINVREAMDTYPDRTAHDAVSKLAKYRFQVETAFTGYD